MYSSLTPLNSRGRCHAPLDKDRTAGWVKEPDASMEGESAQAPRGFGVLTACSQLRPVPRPPELLSHI